MAVTTVNLEFAYNTDSVVDLSVGSFQLATIPNISASLNLFSIELDNSLLNANVGSLSRNVVEVQIEGSLVTQGRGFGSLDVLQLTASGIMFTPKQVSGDASIIEVQMEAGGYVSSRQSMSKEAVLISMSGLLVQGVDGNNVIVLVPTEEDADYPNITGEEYIVVNLRTKAHATYRDGERTALAKTASLDFGSHTEKSISDLYLLSRARGPLEVVVNTREEIDRHYPLQFGEMGQANIKNKKLALAKGLRGTNWTISLVVPDGSHLEVRGMTLYVTDTERHN